LIIVFAKAPVAGQAKTRLIPRIGAWRAARLHARLIRETIQTALAARCGPVELHGTRPHSIFRSLNVRFRQQRGHDLGERMYRALAQARGPAIVIGTDCPALTPADLQRAARCLRGGYDAVIAPAEDGGYALFGTNHPKREWFEGIEWGGSTVYAETVKRVQNHRWRALRRLWDVDRPEDLERLRSLRLASRSRRRALQSPCSPARSGGSGRT
jgi:rSAM/selenodomain-associated transferase 1